MCWAFLGSEPTQRDVSTLWKIGTQNDQIQPDLQDDGSPKEDGMVWGKLTSFFSYYFVL